ncbi:acryloyl-CoA reductase (NADH) [mine drainage metagenome]|uniref:Acryloyl-CoA reductase (NADH) n=1 Tax=mine drainage metagenome TaxID=410659 RepID=A0A1J5QEP7_9ZZZZ
MNFGLTQEQEMIVSTVRSFVENEIYPHEKLVEDTREVPREIAEEIKRKTIELGFYACNFPESVGGAGLSHVEFALVERELGRGSMALNHFFGRPQNILMACKGEQIDRYLKPAVRGERMDALAMTEPDAGSDIRGMKTTARRDGGDWVLNGTKHFISGAEHADFVIVFVATGEEEAGGLTKKKITTFLVDRGTPGFTIREGYKSVSHRGYKNMILEFDNCRLPDTQVLGEVDGGFAVMNEWLYATRITVATMSVGRARRVFDIMLDYAASRKQFGQPIGKFQGVGFQLADSITEIDAADWLTLAAAWRLDQGMSANREIASAKVYATEMLARVTDRAIQVHGGMGLMDDLPLERFWRDARVERIWDGTSEIQRHIIARDLLRPLGA